MSIFSSVPVFKPKTNKIDLSHQSILTTSFGKLTPCLCEEVLPGDIFKVKTELFLRFQPLLAPIMDQCDVSIHYYNVPSRLAYEHFYKFLSDEEANGQPAIIPFSYFDDVVLYTYYISGHYGTSGTYNMNKSLMDYFNLPTENISVTEEGTPGGPHTITTNAPHIPINMIPFISYYLIWDKYYRDENLEDNSNFMEALRELRNYGGDVSSFTTPAGDSLLQELVRIRYRAYKKDYFTSALPWPQKGDEVYLPVGQQDVEFYYPNGVTQTSLSNVYSNPYSEQGHDFAQLESGFDLQDTDVIKARTAKVKVTINDLRTSMRVQQLLENNARGGTRQQEFIKAHWGVYAKDARINDPEYIGGASVPIQISEVLSQVANQSAGSTSTDNALGQLGGHGITAGFGSSKKYRVTEHGYIIAILSVRPKASYFQGIPRMFSHLARYDYFFPELSHLGEQEIKNKEIYVNSSVEDAEGTFGYTPRYAEYKYHCNEVHGDFRDTLKYWHTARIFGNLPGLNSSFISINPSNQGQNRIFTYVNGDYDQILVQLYHHNAMLRKMPYYGIPKF